MCTSINGRKRLLVAKLDFLYKHVDWKKAKTNTLEMVEGTIYNYPNLCIKKMKHCVLYVFIMVWFINWALGEIGENFKKVQFVILFYLLKEGHPMMNYESLKDFFCFIKIKNVSRKHWFGNLGWEGASNVGVG